MANTKTQKTLHLILKKKWFDMIKSGEKKEEYRDVTPHWVSRLTGLPHDWKKDDREGLLSELLDPDFIYMRYYKTITFTNGYRPDSPRFEIECKGIYIGLGNTEWGAVSGKSYFVIKLGEVVTNG